MRPGFCLWGLGEREEDGKKNDPAGSLEAGHGTGACRFFLKFSRRMRCMEPKLLFLIAGAMISSEPCRELPSAGVTTSREGEF